MKHGPCQRGLQPSGEARNVTVIQDAEGCVLCVETECEHVSWRAGMRD